MHPEVSEPETARVLESLSRDITRASNGWYLVGGTALALEFGHRKFIDLNFFADLAVPENLGLVRK